MIAKCCLCETIYLRPVFYAYDEKYKKEVATLLLVEFAAVLSCHSSDLLESSTVQQHLSDTQLDGK
jgi:hypothetical protein